MSALPHKLSDASEKQKKTHLFRQELEGKELSFLMEAHNALSAIIVQQEGFKGVWASGLSMATALGVRDCNEASWTQILDILEFMSDGTDIPILMDGDTGFGNFNNARRLVKKLCQRGIAAVCLEDKQFPKKNSFAGGHQSLADVAEFSGKIMACKDSQLDDAFCVLARCESFIAGESLSQALQRAEAYRKAGADGIVIHSKKNTADEVLKFALHWANRTPLVVIPTTYYNTPMKDFRDVSVSMVIWANHNLRTTINALRACCRSIYQHDGPRMIEMELPTVADVFDLTDQLELKEAERRFLPQQNIHTKASRQFTGSVDRPELNERSIGPLKAGNAG